MKPYYEDTKAGIVIYHGDCREILPTLGRFGAVVSDPPYPNNAGHFDEGVDAARGVVRSLPHITEEALVFWTEIEQPCSSMPLVGVHIWHRANVNGRPYEPIYHFAVNGEKRRSEVYRHAVEFENATGAEYLGHPTQKPVALMRHLLKKTTGTVCDPFCGVGSTLRAAKDLGRKAIGIEIEERYCEIAAKRLAQEVLAL